MNIAVDGLPKSVTERGKEVILQPGEQKRYPGRCWIGCVSGSWTGYSHDAGVGTPAVPNDLGVYLWGVLIVAGDQGCRIRVEEKT